MTEIQNDIFLFTRNFPYTNYDLEPKKDIDPRKDLSTYPSIPQPSDYGNAFVVDWQMTEKN